MSAVSELAVKAEADRLKEAKRIDLQEKDLYVRVITKANRNFSHY